MKVAIDVGGTFTDFVVLEEHGTSHYKVPSDPGSPWRSVEQGIEDLKHIHEIFHGTTIGTNAFLEGKGARTAFITNKGFEDILFIGRQDRPELYSTHVRKRKPPVHICCGIKGRLDANGEEIEPLDVREIEALALWLKEQKISASICLLHSFANEVHENRVGEIMAKHGVEHSLSSSVSPEIREYERGMTVFMDAYLTPVMRGYFDKLQEILEVRPYMMKSGGSLEFPDTISPVDTLLSGPAGGTAGAAYISRLTGKKNLITLDIGGTSADMSTVTDGKLSWKDQGDIDGFPILSKMVDIVTIGSGGGSIARVDEGGMLRVGPHSAGAYPGPVCYGRGGNDPTVTDAHLLMGHIDPAYFLGGKMHLDKTGAERALKELSTQAGSKIDDTLLGIYQISIAKMARSIRGITVGRGLDPEDFTLLAFGGAGPLYGAILAESLGVPGVMIPTMPGVFSALGMVTSEVTCRSSRTLLTRLSDGDGIQEAMDKLQREIPMEGGRRVYLGLRYEGQSHHLNVPYTHETEDIFHREHHREYGYHLKDAHIEVVRVEVEMYGERSISHIPYSHVELHHPPPRECLFHEGWLKTDIYYRNGLAPGKSSKGPAIIEDTGSSIMVPPGWSFTVDEHGMIHMEVARHE